MWGSQEKILRHKVNENFFRVDPGKKIQNSGKNVIFRETLVS